MKKKEQLLSIEEGLVKFGVGQERVAELSQVIFQQLEQEESSPELAHYYVKPYYVSIDGNTIGPLCITEFIYLYRKHKLNKETLVWYPGLREWIPIGEDAHVLSLIVLVPPPIGK